MRPRDDNKTEAIFAATIQLVNEIGFAETSMSKIAKRAQVSAATIYIHFANKEDLLSKTYLKAKQLMSDKVFRDVDATAAVRERFERFAVNFVAFILDHSDSFLFMEQVANSPLLQNWCLDGELGALYQPMLELFEEGKRQGVFKQEDSYLLTMYSVLPIAQLAKAQVKGEFQFDQEKLAKAIQFSWDAIKA